MNLDQILSGMYLPESKKSVSAGGYVTDRAGGMKSFNRVFCILLVNFGRKPKMNNTKCATPTIQNALLGIIV
jgi:hypothetical protein